MLTRTSLPWIVSRRVHSMMVGCLVLFLLFICQAARAQDFSVFATPSKHLVLADEKKGEATFIGGQYLDGPLLAVRDGTPYIFVLGPDLAIWMRTLTTEWSSLGGRCSGLKSVVNTPGSLSVEAFCTSPSEVWNFPIIPQGSAAKTSASSMTAAQVLKAQFLDDRFAVYKNPAKEAVVVDLVNLKTHALKGGLLQEPHALMLSDEPTIFGVGLDNAIWTRSISQPWRTLGGKSDVITSVTLVSSGTDATIVIPGKRPETILSRTLTSEWRETTPFADYPIDIASITGDPSDTLGPVTQVDKYIESFIDAWGDDIVTLRTLKTQAEFEGALPSLKTTVLETKLIQQFSSTPLREILPKLLMAFPRSKYSDGSAAAMKSYLNALGQDKAGVSASFSSVIKDLADDPIADQRGVVLDLFSRVPGITDTYRAYLLTSLRDKNLGVSPGALTALGRKYFAVMLSHSLLGTEPTPDEARAGVTNALKTPLDADQEEDLKAALERYLDYTDSFLTCGASGCEKRPQKGGACSATTPCVVGLQCFKGTCSEFGEKGESCGTNHPFCHPLFSCSGDTTSTARTCVERAKLNESCKDRACQYGLSCLKRLGICVDTAKEGEACAGISKPCVDGSTLSCVGGYCKKKGTIGKTCRADDPCVDSLVCSNPAGGVCEKKRALGEGCSPSDPCQDGLTCFTAIGVVGSTSGTCRATVGLGKPCDISTFCDSSQGLFCGSQGICRAPGTQGEYCAQDGECSPGLLCNSRSCSVPHGRGGTCQIDKHCQEGLICDQQAGSATKGTCLVKGGEGAACPCAAGFSCIHRGYGQASACKADVASGGGCGGVFGVCAAGLECAGGGVSGIGTCRPLARLNDLCSGLLTAVKGNPRCAPGLFCNRVGQCEAGRTEGEECSGPFGGPCAEGYACTYQNGIGRCTASCSRSSMNNPTCGQSAQYACRQIREAWFEPAFKCFPKLQFRSICTPSFDSFTPPCQDDLFCSPTLMTCQFRSRRGEPCSLDGSQPCEPQLNCWGGRCF